MNIEEMTADRIEAAGKMREILDANAVECITARTATHFLNVSDASIRYHQQRGRLHTQHALLGNRAQAVFFVAELVRAFDLDGDEPHTDALATLDAARNVSMYGFLPNGGLVKIIGAGMLTQEQYADLLPEPQERRPVGNPQFAKQVVR